MFATNTGSVHNNIFFRRCVEGCDQYGSPACPICPAGQICSLLAPTCDECQKTVCVAQSAAPSTISSSPKSSSLGSHGASAIAGGVLVGLAAIAGTIFLVWRYYSKRKRYRYPIQSWGEGTDYTLGTEKPFTVRADARSSTHTTVSTASSAFTRASNVIQIAYIPGVMDRSAPSTPGLLVPPVPPIPITLSSSYAGSPSFEQEHFFMPGDLRDSTYSSRTSRTSFERNSVASTAYEKNGIISPASAQTGIRGKAAMVSVRSNPSSGEMPPTLHNFDYTKFNDASMPSPAFSVGSTFLNHASTATRTRARIIPNNKISTENLDRTEADRSPNGNQTLMDLDENTSLDGLQPLKQRPFHHSLKTRSSIGSLSAVIDEASRKAALNRPTKRATSPFGDENEMD